MNNTIKNLAILFIFGIFLFNFVSAANIEMNSNYSQGETLIAKISGNFINPPSVQNIKLYRNHVRVPFEFELTKIENDYYLYGQLSNKEPNNYSLVLENIKYSVFGEIKEEDLSSNFIITDNLASFSISPGFIISEKNFNVSIQNRENNNLDVVVISNKTSEDVSFWESLFGSSSISGEEVTLEPYELLEYELNFDNITKTSLIFVSISSENTQYALPVYVQVEEDSEDENNHKSIDLRPSEINITISTNTTTSRIFYLFNDGNSDLERINFTLSEELKRYVDINPSIDYLDKNDSEKIIINITSPEEERNISGYITAKVSVYEVYTYLTLNLKFVKDYIPPEGEEVENPIYLFSCSEIKGVVCEKNQICSGNSEDSSDGVCCLGTCEEKKTSSSSTLVGWILLAVILGFVAWFFLFKHRKGPGNIDLFRFARRR